MRSPVLRLAVPALVVGVLATSAWATPPIGKRARDAGFAEAQDCAYCHTFGSSHQREKAVAMGIAPMNCVACHGSRLPDSRLYNDRGRWLLAEKDRRKAKDVDVAWLKDYPDPAKDRHKSAP